MTQRSRHRGIDNQDSASQNESKITLAELEETDLEEPAGDWGVPKTAADLQLAEDQSSFNGTDYKVQRFQEASDSSQSHQALISIRQGNLHFQQEEYEEAFEEYCGAIDEIEEILFPTDEQLRFKCVVYSKMAECCLRFQDWLSARANAMDASCCRDENIVLKAEFQILKAIANSGEKDFYQQFHEILPKFLLEENDQEIVQKAKELERMFESQVAANVNESATMPASQNNFKITLAELEETDLEGPAGNWSDPKTAADLQLAEDRSSFNGTDYKVQRFQEASDSSQSHHALISIRQGNLHFQQEEYEEAFEEYFGAINEIEEILFPTDEQLRFKCVVYSKMAECCLRFEDWLSARANAMDASYCSDENIVLKANFQILKAIANSGEKDFYQQFYEILPKFLHEDNDQEIVQKAKELERLFEIQATAGVPGVH